MRYGQDDRESGNVEDRRGQRGPIFRFPMGGRRGRPMRIPIGGRGISLTSLLIIGGLLLLFGVNPLDLLSQG
ncbi:MAG: metalloprotease, partial [Hyphomicrobiaceae bacterium]|nr:metalloprotease [Hyphomicrobiaceae bacterium]